MDFVDRQVTPAFPDGLTVQDGRGQWRDRNGVIERERSYELILLYPVGRAKAADPGIEGIRDAYEKEFGQEAVARAGRTDARGLLRSDAPCAPVGPSGCFPVGPVIVPGPLVPQKLTPLVWGLGRRLGWAAETTPLPGGHA